MGRLSMYFSVDKRHRPDLVLLQCFLWIRGTGLSLVLSHCFLWMEALACIGVITMFLCRRLLFCRVRAEIFLQHVTVYSGGRYFLLFLLFSHYRCFSQTTVGGGYWLV